VAVHYAILDVFKPLQTVRTREAISSGAKFYSNSLTDEAKQRLAEQRAVLVMDSTIRDLASGLSIAKVAIYPDHGAYGSDFPNPLGSFEMRQ
jgi:hypothetical protein